MHRDNSLARWAEHLQSDFRARMDWCVKDRADANHPPQVYLRIASNHEAGQPSRAPTILRQPAVAGTTLTLDAAESRDPDGDTLRFEWLHYPEPGGSQNASPKIDHARAQSVQVSLPDVAEPTSVHVVLVVTDDGEPPLARYGRVVIDLEPRAALRESRK
jgi:hypothetical protein